MGSGRRTASQQGGGRALPVESQRLYGPGWDSRADSRSGPTLPLLKNKAPSGKNNIILIIKFFICP